MIYFAGGTGTMRQFAHVNLTTADGETRLWLILW